MTALDLVAVLRARGVELRQDGERLVCRPKSLLSEDDLDALRAMKPDVLAALRTPAASAQRARIVCYACRGRCFWRSIHGSVVCAACHPPAAAWLVAAWLGHEHADWEATHAR